MNIRNKSTSAVLSVVFLLNFILFAVKLYVGLSSNSISIYSDGINNLFDGISAVTGLVCFFLLSGCRDLSLNPRSEKTEQLFSFVLSAVIVFTGGVFFFNSLERLMYPAPVWFTASYFYIIAATAAVKLLLFFFLRSKSRKNGGSMLRVMSLDSLLDFFITAVTFVTLLVSQRGGASFDAYAGLVISVLILISGVGSFRKSIKAVVGIPPKRIRQKAEEILSEYGITAPSELEFSFSSEESVNLKTSAAISDESLSEIKKRLKEETGISLYLLK
ncbi:MAG: cation diffusion facilitator family transporter [Ruminococcaceae bacterium]|nr:cation diffusion facilitator family transporter [Oscillospiraceae bacterium]